MTAQAQARVDGGALRRNLARVRKLSSGARVMAVVKANAYGHGITNVARALADADALAVARMSEAVAVRDAGCNARVLLLEGIMTPNELDLAARYHFDLVVHRRDQIDMLAAYHGGGHFRVWLKIDTGMNRLGFKTDEARAAFVALNALGCVQQPLTLMTHLASADDPHDTTAAQQIELFRATTAGWPGERSIANSASILRHPSSHGDWVRPGLMMYGASPMANQSAQDLNLTPVMTLWSKVIAVKRLEAGEQVGYGGTWVAPEDTQLGIVAAGYGDGYPWRLPSGTPVLIRGRRVPMVGRVSMDMIAVDLGQDTDVDIGDEAILWGPGLGVEELAASIGTIPYELLCGISQRVRIDMLSQSVPR
ncbi:MAG: alanine racemase [Gammaproteobacteria bacterium]